MDSLSYKHQKLTQALTTLNTAIKNFTTVDSMTATTLVFTDYPEMRRTYRDSLVQRFEFSVDLFWKYLKRYLEVVAKPPNINAPNPVIRESYTAALLNEKEAEQALKMLKARNLTSHIYVEEIAEELSSKIPGYYQLMHEVVQRLAPQQK